MARPPKGGGDAFFNPAGQSFDEGMKAGKALAATSCTAGLQVRDRFENSGLSS